MALPKVPAGGGAPGKVRVRSAADATQHQGKNILTRIQAPVSQLDHDIASHGLNFGALSSVSASPKSPHSEHFDTQDKYQRPLSSSFHPAVMLSHILPLTKLLSALILGRITMLSNHFGIADFLLTHLISWSVLYTRNNSKHLEHHLKEKHMARKRGGGLAALQKLSKPLGHTKPSLLLLVLSFAGRAAAIDAPGEALESGRESGGLCALVILCYLFALRHLDNASLPLMLSFSFAWMFVSQDRRTGQGTLWTVLIAWGISALLYCRSQFHSSEFIKMQLFITLSLSVMLLGLATFAKTGEPTSIAFLLPPIVGFSLFCVANFHHALDFLQNLLENGVATSRTMQQSIRGVHTSLEDAEAGRHGASEADVVES